MKINDFIIKTGIFIPGNTVFVLTISPVSKENPINFVIRTLIPEKPAFISKQSLELVYFIIIRGASPQGNNASWWYSVYWFLWLLMLPLYLCDIAYLCDNYIIQYIPRSIHKVHTFMSDTILMIHLIWVDFTHILQDYFTVGQSYDCPVPVKQPWRIWVNIPHESTKAGDLKTNWQSTAKLSTYFMVIMYLTIRHWSVFLVMTFALLVLQLMYQWISIRCH